MSSSLARSSFKFAYVNIGMLETYSFCLFKSLSIELFLSVKFLPPYAVLLKTDLPLRDAFSTLTESYIFFSNLL